MIWTLCSTAQLACVVGERVAGRRTSVTRDRHATSASFAGRGGIADEHVVDEPSHCRLRVLAVRVGSADGEKPETQLGGLHESNASGAACWRFGVVHCTNAGVSETRNGVAPVGRG